MKSRTQKREEAQKRNTAWASLSSTHQLHYLNMMGFRAVKQRTKIQEKINHGR